MKIDVTSPEGNTLVALGIATRALRRAGASDDDIGKLRHDVMKAVSANDGRIDLVLKAIAAAGGPGDAGEISARFKAVRDMHKSDANR